MALAPPIISFQYCAVWVARPNIRFCFDSGQIEATRSLTNNQLNAIPKGRLAQFNVHVRVMIRIYSGFGENIDTFECARYCGLQYAIDSVIQ